MEQTANFLDLFMQGATDGMARVQPFAERLVTVLATISIVLTFILGSLRKDFDPISTLIGKILLIGIIVWFVTSWPALLGDLIEGAVFLGGIAGGANDPTIAMQPLSVVTWGWDFALLCFGRMSDLSGPIATFENFDIILVLGVCGLVVAFAYLIIGVTIAVALVEFWIGSTVALVLLPFAVFKPMAFIAQSTFGWVAANAIRLLLLSTIASLGADAFDLLDLVAPADDEITADGAFAGTVVAVFLLAITMSAQRMALGLINGAPQMGGGAVFAAAGSAAVGGAQAIATSGKVGGTILGQAASLGLALGNFTGRRAAVADSKSASKGSASKSSKGSDNS